MKDKAIDQILDLLLDALQERKQERDKSQPINDRRETEEEIAADIANLLTTPNYDSEPEIETVEQMPQAANDDPSAPEPSLELSDSGSNDIEFSSIPSEFDEELESLTPPAPEKLPSINMNKVFYRLSWAMALLIILVNIPFNRFGTNLARAMPDEKALVVRDGLLFTGPGDEVYILDNNRKRWISSLTAFELHGFRWEQVHEVDQAFIDQFEDGPHFHVIIRCEQQPHIYLLEGREKRWIENPAEFERAGLKWEDVRYISCFKLKNDFPDGVPIPQNAGDPPTW